jgi:predicted small secreted protein
VLCELAILRKMSFLNIFCFRKNETVHLKMKRNQIRIAFLALISALTACNSYRHAGTCMNDATDYPHCTQLPLQEYVPEPDYLPLSPELQAFYELNAIRRKLGLGLLAQRCATGQCCTESSALHHQEFACRHQCLWAC